MAGYAKRLRLDMDGWVGRGLIDRATADLMLADAMTRERRSLSFGFILMMMAALLLAAAILLMVAANWEAMARTTRVGTLFAVILIAYVGGAFLKLGDHDAAAEGAWLIGAATFGGAIALVGQMYHLSGDEETALLVWCGGTLVAGAALRSGPLTLAAAGIAVFWMVSEGFELWGTTNLPPTYPLVAATIWLVSVWTRSIATRHLLMLSLTIYAVLLTWVVDVTVVSLAMAAVAALLFAAAVLAPELSEAIAKLNGRLPLHALVAFLVAAAMLQFDRYDESATLILVAIVVFCAIATALLLAGRDSRGLRFVAYLGFTFELCFLYVATLGTMIGTAGLFLISGVALAAIAFLIIRIERRMTAGAAP